MHRIGAMFQRNELAVGGEPVVVPPCAEIGGQNKTVLPSFPFSNDEMPRQTLDQYKRVAVLGMNFPLKLIFCSDALKQMAVSKNGLFEPLMHKNDPFTKTGSGQT
jgi:hypothetical protein